MDTAEHTAWITRLMNGEQTAEEQAARARYRAMMATAIYRPAGQRHAGPVAGQAAQTYAPRHAASTRDGLVTYSVRGL